jgi:hypothetical protein
MTVERIVNRLTVFFSGLYYRQWAKWELIALAIVAAVILLLIIKAHLKVTANERRLRERSPFVGVRMAHHGRRHL